MAALGQIKNKLGVYHSLPDEQKEILKSIGFKDRLSKIENAIRANATVVTAIRSEGDGLLEDMEQEEQARGLLSFRISSYLINTLRNGETGYVHWPTFLHSFT